MTQKAERGDTESMYLLGWYYLSGTGGVEKNEAMAFQWTERAHLAGDVKGTSVLGSMYLVGAGTTKDIKKAVTCLKSAASQCDLAAYYLGMILFNGFPDEGIPADRPQAYRLLQSAASETCNHQILGSKLTADAQRAANKLKDSFSKPTDRRRLSVL